MKISRQTWILVGRIAATAAMLAWICVATSFTMAEAATDRCSGLDVEVVGETSRSFVTSREIMNEIGEHAARANGMYMHQIDTERLKVDLEQIDKIENVTVTCTTDGKVKVRVTPLAPIARVFDLDESYYVNKAGKRITANARYHIDVPVITGHFPREDTTFTVTTLMPLLDHLASHKPWSDFFTMVKVDDPTDIILIPAIAGHVVNFGTPTDFDSKLHRLERMYREVLPVKGWNYYDTLSVKWGGQVVATRRAKPQARAREAVDDEIDDANVTTMLAAEGVAPGRTRLGQKAHNDKLIPAASASAASTSATSNP